MTKMNFVYYCADDMLNGTMTLSVEEELAYRRIVDLIYSTNNKLEDNGRMGWMTKVGDKWEETRKNLIEKNKIQIEKKYIRVERCTDEINKAKLNYEKKQKAAKVRWDNANEHADADADAYANHKPLTTNHKLNNRKFFEEEFWINIRYKKGKEGAWKSFKHINFEKEKFTPRELANQYNDYLDNLPDYQDTPKWVQGWLTDRRWEDEESLTPQAFAKKHRITDGRFLKFEDDVYHFHFTESFGSYTLKYDTKGNIIKDGKRQERTTKEGSGTS